MKKDDAEYEVEIEEAMITHFQVVMRSVGECDM